MDTRKAVLGAAAVLAAGVVSVSTATAKPQEATGRITSLEQLKTSIHQAVIVAEGIDDVSGPVGMYDASV
jgi:hypothetical protein